MYEKRFLACGLVAVLLLGGCSSYPGWIASSGPNLSQITDQDKIDSPILLVNIDSTVVRQLTAAQKKDFFAESLATKAPPKYTVGAGDALEIAVWEAPPAALFGGFVAQVEKSRYDPYPRRSYATAGTATVVGHPSCVNRLSKATRTCNSVT